MKAFFTLLTLILVLAIPAIYMMHDYQVLSTKTTLLLFAADLILAFLSFNKTLKIYASS